MTVQPRWVLAFDAGCGSCRRLSQRIERACAGRLETLPLRHPEVTAWQGETLGPDAPWAPTLFRVGGGTGRGDDVRAWVGRSMIVPLVRHLGLRSSLAVTYALGSLRDEIAADAAPASSRTISRKRFLQFGAGTVIAGALVVRGAMPAYAATPVRHWVKANAHRLPTTYDAIAGYPEDYRRAIFTELSPARRSALWTTHLERFAADRPHLTAAQRRVLDDVRAEFSRVPRFAAKELSKSEVRADQALQRRIETAFGGPDTAALAFTLGPAEADGTGGVRPALSGCTCSLESDACLYTYRGVCSSRYYCAGGGGCGFAYSYYCDGCCSIPGC